MAAPQRDFGRLCDHEAPKDYHPTSIMSLASNTGVGHGSQEGEVVGGVILEGKKQY